MKISQVKKVYSYELQQRLNNDFLSGGEIDYRIRNFLEDICDDGIYKREYLKNKPKLRITFLPFILCVFILLIIGAIKWIFTGSAIFNSDNLVTKSMIKWDKYCRFNIVA